MEEVPPKMQLLDSVWATRRKSKIGTGEICKYKARLNAHWGQQEHDVTYHETYASLLMWATIRLILTLSIIKGCHSRQLDFVLAHPQAKLDGEVYMRLPKDFEIPGCKQKGAMS